MKKITLFAVIVMAVMFSACNNQKNSNELQEKVDSLANVEQLEKQEVDNMVQVINAISSVMDSIQIQEKMIFNMQEGTPKEQVLVKLKAFQELLVQKQAEIDKLKVDNKENKTVLANLTKMVEKLKEDVSAKAAEIEKLRKLVEVKDANISSLKSDLRQVTEIAEDLQDKNYIQEQKLNTVYYIVGTKSELKEKGMLKGGFLSKKKADYANLDKTKFNETDMRGFTKLVIESKNPKIITEKPASSYTLTKNGDGTSTLQITDAQTFWSTSPFLIIQK
jgi:outer membrane murein-binding lipoprotein Lpp/cell division protein FtsB